jgi:hypothetical protein
VHESGHFRRASPIAVLASVLAAALAALLVCGCGKKREPAPGQAGDCAAVGEKLIELGRHSARDLQGRQRTVFETQIQLVKDDVVATCQRQKWPADVRACMLAAADRTAFDACAEALPAPAGAP